MANSIGISRRTGACWRASASKAHNYDYTTYKTPGIYGRFLIAPSRSDNFHLLTPKLGVIYSGFQNITLYANYARGERAPAGLRPVPPAKPADHRPARR